MMNKQERMNKLNAAGMNNTYSMTLNNIPFGKEVRVLIDETEVSLEDLMVKIENGEHIDDSFAEQIMEQGYVKNYKLFRRWITAQTFEMLNYYNGYRNEKGWDAALKYKVPYDRTWTLLLNELKVLSILEKEDKERLEERENFFNLNVVVNMLNHYKYQLRKYWCRQRDEKGRKDKYGNAVVNLAKYGLTDSNELNKIINDVVWYTNNILFTTNSYEEIYKLVSKFLDEVYNRLPWDTPKCPEWKDAYKGAGAYYTLKNLFMFHDVNAVDIDYPYDENHLPLLLRKGNPSVMYLNKLLNKYEREGWRMHEYMKLVIDVNNFDLATSIERHNNNR